MPTPKNLFVFAVLLSLSIICNASAGSAEIASPQQQKNVIIEIVQAVPTGWQAVSPEDDLPLQGPASNQLLSEYRVSGSASNVFQRGQRRVSIKVYHFPSAANAYGAYTTLRKGSSTVVQRGDGSSEDDNSITFWQSGYLFLLSTSAAEDEEAKELMRSIADQFTKALQEHASIPNAIFRLPRQERVKGSEHLVMGPVAGRMFLPIPYVGFLKLDQSQAAIADYQVSYPVKERLKLTVIDYSNRQLALQAYQDYVGNLMGAHSCQSTANSAMFKMPGSFLYCQLDDRELMLISGAHKKESAIELAGQVALRG